MNGQHLKARLKKENSEVVSATTQLKLLAPDGKKRISDMLGYKGKAILEKLEKSIQASLVLLNELKSV